MARTICAASCCAIALGAPPAPDGQVPNPLRGYSKPLAVSTYAGLPARVQELLPTAEDLSRIADDVLRKSSDGS